MRSPCWSTRLRHLVGSLALVAAASTCLAVGAATPSFADDDYPWAGLGHCPLVPLPPPVTDPAGDKDAPDGKPTKPGKPAAAEGKPAASADDTEDTDDTTPDVPRVCAKNIWFVNGSFADPWGFALRNCTSFVSWRLREANGIADFSNRMDGGHWGNAEHWDENARALGYLVDHVPAIGAVAQTDDGRVGHVAWVSAVDGDMVTVEEYNHAGPGIYGTRTVPASDFRYLHLDDVAPAPSRGSTRARVIASDAAGRTWTFRVDRSGTLVRRQAGARPHTVGPKGGWSRLAAPTTSVDAEGLVWLAAVRSDGRIWTTHSTLRGGWTRPQPVRRATSAPTSSPALVPDGRRGVRLLAVSADGDLMQVRRNQHGWGRPLRMGAARSWSTHTAVSTAVDGAGRTWLAAIAANGRLLLRSTTPRGDAWHRFVTAPGSSWSLTATPALSTRADGGLRLHAVTAQGRLALLRIGPGGKDISGHRVIAGSWSPYSSPAVALDAKGRTWVAAVTTHGRVLVRHRTQQGWTPWRRLGRADEVSSPALDPHSDGRVLLSTTTAGRQVVLLAGGSKRQVGARLLKLHGLPAT